MIETTEALVAHLQQSSGAQPNPICAIDTEADSLHRYRESLCLIQFADRDSCVLMDPLVIEDLSPLGDFLNRSVVWMHGADYDMTMLRRQFGSVPLTVFDTQIGARLLGVRRFGLGDLVLRYFNVELSKSSQKADWGKRPLSEKMISYALNDVAYLLEMGDMIVADLREKQRYDWFLESCETARQKVVEREESKDNAWRIQGSGRLDPKGLAYLRALWNWRDGEARAWDRPSFMVATNKQLLEWCSVLADGGKAGLPPHYRSERIKRFRVAVEAVESLSRNEWPERPQFKRRKRDRDFDNRVAAGIKARDAIAEQLDIEGSLIAARAVIEGIVAGEISAEASLMRWQRELLGPVLN